MIDRQHQRRGELRCAAHSARSRCISARESPPPDTATAQAAAGMTPPSPRAKRCFKLPRGLLAAGGFAEAGGAGEGLRRGIGIFRLDEAKRGAAFRFLAHAP